MADYTVGGIQQVGIGVPDVDAAWTWYRSQFGADVGVFDDTEVAGLMTRYTGGIPQSRRAALAMNLSGGGGFEIWQFTSRTPTQPAFQPALGDFGILAVKLKSKDVAGAYERLRRAGDAVVGDVTEAPGGGKHFFVRDPLNNLFEIVEGIDWFGPVRRSLTGGVAGVTIGVANIDDALPLYRGILNYDRVVFDETDEFPDLADLPGGIGTFRRVLLGHSEPRRGPFAGLLGSTQIELIQRVGGEPGRRIFDGRFWGDLGFIHVCFDVQAFDELKDASTALGFTLTVDSGATFDMGEAGGRFGYIEDPDGTLIELVETHKMPLLSKLGLTIDLTKRPPGKPLSKVLLKLMSLKRKK
jgi:catechol 2,3-dioxygenase-like lactoylglutathione lyase family enzyme